MAIDLERDALPHTLVCDGGKTVEVVTSFRVWLRWGRLLSAGVLTFDVLLGEPQEGWVRSAMEFYNSPVVTPRSTGNTEHVRAMDFALLWLISSEAAAVVLGLVFFVVVVPVGFFTVSSSCSRS